MKQTIRYMNGDELAERMKSGKEGKPEFVVVDVRDGDFIGGNIKGAINIPSEEFGENVEKLVEDTEEYPLVIFHCALSQIRGPKAARMYAETRKKRHLPEGKGIEHEIAILRDGFTGFQAKYRKDPDLIENWDKDCWGDWSAPQDNE